MTRYGDVIKYVYVEMNECVSKQRTRIIGIE